MSRTPAGQGSAPAGVGASSGGAAVPSSGGAPRSTGTPAPEGTGGASARAGGWTAAAAKYAPALIAAAAMAILGVWGLARDSSMGNDEVATRWAALLSLHNLAHLLNTVDAVHGLYYLMMHGWVAVGTSPTVLRIPSVIAMVAAVAMTAILARRLTGSGWAALFAGLVMALTPVISYYAQTARSYAFVVACVLASTLALLHALDAEAPGAPGRPVARRWVAYGALITLGGYLNEMSLLVLAAHAVTVLLARYGRQALRHWAAAGTVGAALCLPLLLLSVREHAAVSWIARPGLSAIRILFQDYFGATPIAAVLLLVCAIAAVLPSAAWWRQRRTGAAGNGAAAGKEAAAGDGAAAGHGAVPENGAVPGNGTAPGNGAAPGTGAGAEVPWWRTGGVSLPSVAAPLLVLPAALLFGESLVASPLYVDRYVLYGEAGAALLAGAGMVRIGRWLADAAGRRTLFWVAGVVVCVCALLLQLGPQHRVRTPQSRAYDFGGPSRYVAAHARPGDGVLFFSTFFRKARLGYPADFAKTSDFAMAVSPQQAGDFRGTDKPFRTVEPLMLARQRIWVIGNQPSSHLLSSAFRAESAVLAKDFSLVLKRHFRGMTVTLWQRR